MVDLTLYALVDPSRDGGNALPDLARQVAEGGATLIQLRHKTAAGGDFVALARAVKRALRGTGVPLLINDRVDVALAAGADGVHLGQEDVGAVDARRLLGPRAIIGLTVKSHAHAAAAPWGALDYVAIGGVFGTTTKHNPDPPVGLDGLSAIAEAVRRHRPGLPVGAIAGIDASNAASVIAAGADGVAVVSALSEAPDPRHAAVMLRNIIDEALQKRRQTGETP